MTVRLTALVSSDRSSLRNNDPAAFEFALSPECHIMQLTETTLLYLKFSHKILFAVSGMKMT